MTSSPSIEFWLFYGSTYSYLSAMRIGEMARALGVAITWRPFDLRPISQSLGMPQGPFRANPPKLKYMWRDIARRAHRHGLPFRDIPPYPLERPEILATRVALIAAEDGWCEDFTRAVYGRAFAEGEMLGDEPQVVAALRAIDRDPDAVIAAARSAEIDRMLLDATETARSMGVFGSPTFVVDGELFWGDDRLDDALDWATNPRSRLNPPH